VLYAEKKRFIGKDDIQTNPKTHRISLNLLNLRVIIILFKKNMNSKIMLKNNKFFRVFDFKKEHEDTILKIFCLGGITEFKNRHKNLKTDIFENEISWKLCDDLIDMGLLTEDEESYNVRYAITTDGILVSKKLLGE
jgi:hypothetical protein